MANHKLRPEIIDALKGKNSESVRFSNTTKDKMIYVAIPIKNGSNIIFVALASMSVKKINFLIDDLK